MDKPIAGQEPVKKPEDGVENQQPIAPEVDPEVVIGQLLEANKKLASERENMRKGMLKAKGKWHEPEPVESEPPQEVNTEMEELVKQSISKLDTEFAESEKQLETEVKRLAKENKELKKSLANRSQVGGNVGGASNVETPVKDHQLSEEKLSHLKNVLKWSPEKIEAFKLNLRKG